MLKCSKKCLLLLQLTGAYHQQAPDLIKASPVAVETNLLSCEFDSVDLGEVLLANAESKATKKEHSLRIYSKWRAFSGSWEHGACSKPAN